MLQVASHDLHSKPIRVAVPGISRPLELTSPSSNSIGSTTGYPQCLHDRFSNSVRARVITSIRGYAASYRERGNGRIIRSSTMSSDDTSHSSGQNTLSWLILELLSNGTRERGNLRYRSQISRGRIQQPEPLEFSHGTSSRQPEFRLNDCRD